MSYAEDIEMFTHYSLWLFLILWIFAWIAVGLHVQTHSMFKLFWGDDKGIIFGFFVAAFVLVHWTAREAAVQSLESALTMGYLARLLFDLFLRSVYTAAIAHTTRLIFFCAVWAARGIYMLMRWIVFNVEGIPWAWARAERGEVLR